MRCTATMSGGDDLIKPLDAVSQATWLTPS